MQVYFSENNAFNIITNSFEQKYLLLDILWIFNWKYYSVLLINIVNIYGFGNIVFRITLYVFKLLIQK